MTNYNERLDEILDLPNITRMAKEKGSDVSDIDKHIKLKIVFYDGKHETYPITLSYDLVKQALTSLIKELVAEAKPLYYASPDKSEYQDGFNTCIRLYEQNLLKALSKETSQETQDD